MLIAVMVFSALSVPEENKYKPPAWMPTIKIKSHKALVQPDSMSGFPDRKTVDVLSCPQN